MVRVHIYEKSSEGSCYLGALNSGNRVSGLDRASDFIVDEIKLQSRFALKRFYTAVSRYFKDVPNYGCDHNPDQGMPVNHMRDCLQNDAEYERDPILKALMAADGSESEILRMDLVSIDRYLPRRLDVKSLDMVRTKDIVPGFWYEIHFEEVNGS